ncbi:nucleolin [Taenia crassiceps]|uniref:Nucleolin n=1 Tax=Taenia crassiceps TaxID=6207 RepID=A0ABR4QEI8_9CEST
MNSYGGAPPARDYRGAPISRSLCVYNYPRGMREADLHPFFPNAVSISCQQRGSSSCLIQFQSDVDCQAAFNECQNGKLVGGRAVQAEIVPSFGSDHSFDGGNGIAYPLLDRSSFERGDSACGTSSSRDNGSNYFCQSPDCTLTLRNLAWSVTEDDLIREFPRAVNASIKLDERNRSRGWGTVTFVSPGDCRRAEAECLTKSINGRPVRAEIGHLFEGSREDSCRGGRGGRRPFCDRYNGGGRRGGGSYDGEDMRSRRRYDNVDGNERRSFGTGNSGGASAGQRWVSGGGFDRDRRDRSAGYRRTGGGARITSAVIRRAPGDSSDSDFDSRG